MFRTSNEHQRTTNETRKMFKNKRKLSLSTGLLTTLLITCILTLFTNCSNNSPTRVCSIAVPPDAPVEITKAVQKELCIDDYFVLLDDNDRIVTSKQRGQKTLDNDSRNIYFKIYDPQNENISTSYENYRLDLTFKYDTLGNLDKLFLKTQKYEHDFWHSYTNSGSFDLMLDTKQSRLKPKQQQKIVLEKIISIIKKIAFK